MPTLKLTESTKLDIGAFKTEDGELHINLRKFYKTKNSDDWKPARQGMTLPAELAGKFIKRLKTLLENIEEEAVELESKSKKSKSKDKDEKPKKSKSKR